jgi:thymidylate synthase ThyX
VESAAAAVRKLSVLEKKHVKLAKQAKLSLPASLRDNDTVQLNAVLLRHAALLQLPEAAIGQHTRMAWQSLLTVSSP